MQLASDDFNRADSATLGANWTAVAGTTGIVTNQAAPKTFTGTDSMQRYSGISWPSNQYSEIVISQNVASGGPGPAVRMSDVAFTVYVCYCNTGSGVNLAKWIAGVFTGLATLPAFSIGDKVRLTVIDTMLYVYQNGALIVTVADSSISSGFAGLSSGADLTNRADNWSGGDTTEIGIFT